jgi:hypothetical protein
LTLLLAFLLLSAAGVPRASAADIDITKTAAGFTLTYMKLAADGRAERWNLKLEPGGHMVFKGNHVPDAPAGCAGKGGHFELASIGAQHLPLVRAAVAAREEQDPLQNLPGHEPDRSGHFSFRLETEFGPNFVGSRIVAPEAPKTAAFLAELKKFYPALFKSAFKAVSVTASLDKATRTATLTFRNDGVIAANVLLPERGTEAFFLQTGHAFAGVSYRETPQSRKIVLKPGGTTLVRLRLPPTELPAGALLVYDNIGIAHHESRAEPPLNLRLCAPLN